MATEEMIDVITPQGVYTSETLPKSIVHQRGLWHACVHGVVTDGSGSVLAQYRGPDVALMRNVWDVMGVAGHISAYTDDPAKRDLLQQAMATLVRETNEELGVPLSQNDFLTEECRMIGMTRTNQPTEDGWMDKTLNLNFLLVLPGLNLDALKLEPGKVLAVEWRPIDEIETWLYSREGDAYAVREPDNFELTQGAVDAARRSSGFYVH